MEVEGKNWNWKQLPCRILSYTAAESSSCSAQFSLDGFAYANNASVTLLCLLKNLDNPASNILYIPLLQPNLKRTNNVASPSVLYDRRGSSKLLASGIVIKQRWCADGEHCSP